jgi:hypothetical protein
MMEYGLSNRKFSIFFFIAIRSCPCPFGEAYQLIQLIVEFVFKKIEGVAEVVEKD